MCSYKGARMQIDEIKNKILQITKPAKTTYRNYQFVVGFKVVDKTHWQKQYFCEKATAMEFWQKGEAYVKCNKGFDKRQNAVEILEYRQSSFIVKELGLTISKMIEMYQNYEKRLKEANLPALSESLTAYVAWRSRNNPNIVLSQARRVYIDSFPTRNRKDVSQEYAERMLEKMQNEMGDLPLTHFTPDTLLNWINASKNRRGLVNKCNPKNTSLRTKYNMLGIVRAFFTYCRKQGYISRNPCSGVVLPPLPASNPEAYTPEETAFAIKLFPANSYERLYVCLAAFSGIRPTELGRLTWRNIDLNERDITLNAAVTKTCFRRKVRIQDNLMEWLELWKSYWNSDLPVLPKCSNYQRHILYRMRTCKRVIFDGFRHSCASYLLALTGNSADTAEQLGHRVEILKTNYMDLVRKDKAIEYFNIRPSTISTYGGLYE